MDVELVHLDDCPLWREAAQRVREAMGIAGLDPTTLGLRGVAGEDVSVDFPGSPTILVNGRDPFPAETPAGPSCRRYPTERGLAPAPSLDQLLRVLTRWAAATSQPGGDRDQPARHTARDDPAHAQ